MQKKIVLNDGNIIPQFGLGVYQIPEGEATENAVKEALRLGYRHIDTAHAYQNERSVGRAIHSSEIPISEIWITSKLWPSDYDDASQAIERMLERLNLKQIDLLLLHQQVGNYRKAWISLENAVKSGKVKSIGISNFDGERLVDLFNFADIKPSVLQVETHPYHQQKELQEFLKPYGTKIESWYPLGHGDQRLLDESRLKKIAQKYNKTVAQIILRWHIQEGIIVFPRSTRVEHLAENINIFDFELSCTEIKEIRKLDKKQPYFTMTYDEQVQNFLSWKLKD